MGYIQFMRSPKSHYLATEQQQQRIWSKQVLKPIWNLGASIYENFFILEVNSLFVLRHEEMCYIPNSIRV